MKKTLSDVLIVAGCGLIVYGAYLINPLAAVFTGGVALISLGWVFGLEASL